MFENKKNLGEDDMYSQVVYKNGRYVSDEQPPVFVYRTPRDESGGVYNMPYPRKGILTMLSESIFPKRNSAANTREYQYLLRLHGKSEAPMDATDYSGSLGHIAQMYAKVAERNGADDAFEFIENRLCDEKKEDYHLFETFAVQMPPEHKIVLLKEAEDERDSLHKKRTALLESLLELGTEESLRKFAMMEYIEPKIDKYGKGNHYIDEGRDLYYAMIQKDRVKGEFEAQKNKEERAMAGHYTPFTFNPCPILATRMKRAENKLKEAQDAFERVMPKLLARDSGALYKGRKRGIAPENAAYFESKKQLTQKELIELHSQKLESNKLLQSAGWHKPTAYSNGRNTDNGMPDYSLHERDRERGTERKNSNLMGNPIKEEYGVKSRQDGKLWSSYPKVTQEQEEYKERAIAEFEDKTKTQDYTPDLIDNIAKKLKFW